MFRQVTLRMPGITAICCSSTWGIWESHSSTITAQPPVAARNTCMDAMLMRRWASDIVTSAMQPGVSSL